MYIYQNNDWPNFTWNNEIILSSLGKVRNLQGLLIGKMGSLGFRLQSEAVLKTLTLEVQKSTEIEGEILESDQVRSSIARHLRMDVQGLVYSGKDVDGVVDMMLDATQNFESPLTADRLFDWHRSLFPTGENRIHPIEVGKWRSDSSTPMQVLSGSMGKEKIHFQAPDAATMENEMNSFINWFNNENKLDPVIKAGLAHFWFVTIHPFDDGNGRIARALSEMLLARSDGIPQRFYSMSAQIRLERKQYYNILESTQHGLLDITPWFEWFLNCLFNALHESSNVLEMVLSKHNFWNKHAVTVLNSRQILLLNKLLDGFIGKLTSSKWAKIAKCSPDTALRDINDLIKKDILVKEEAGGRSTSYVLG
ncbi:MAG: Fic family protein [Candidatus Delongbacteria bacterium]|jgi:Fic family protein|nr:Fic family protein [Candidatus Delongbacteria bacterium]